MFAFLGFLFFLIILFFIALVVNSRIQRLTYEESFSRGKVPDPVLHGAQQGNAHVLYGAQVGWKGKRFSVGEGTGVNILTGTGQRLASILTPRYKKFEKQPDGTVTAYEFKTSVGAGLKNPQQQVLKLNYNLDTNPSIIRIIEDEVVEIDPGRYLGKINLQILPGLFWTIGYFALQKAEWATAAKSVQAVRSEVVVLPYPPNIPTPPQPQEVHATQPATVSVPELVAPAIQAQVSAPSAVISIGSAAEPPVVSQVTHL